MNRRLRKIPFTLTINLMGDWRPLAVTPVPARSDHDWRYFGIVTINGVTGALAWKAGDYGIAVGDTRCGRSTYGSGSESTRSWSLKVRPAGSWRRATDLPRCGARVALRVLD